MDENTRKQVEAAEAFGTDPVTFAALLQAQTLNRIADALEGPQAPSELLEAPQDASRAPQPPQDASGAPVAASGGSPWLVGPADPEGPNVWHWRSGCGAVLIAPFHILPGEHYAIGLRPTTPPPAVAGGWTEYRQPVEAEGPYVLIPIGDGGTTALLRWDLVVSSQPWAPVGTNPGPWPF